MKRALCFAVTTVALAGSLLAISACKRSGDGATADKGADAGRRGGGGPGVAFTVDLLPVEAKKLDYVVAAPGTIEAFERVQVTARVAGVVDRVSFKEGQEVKAGDVLVMIDAERFRLAVNSSRAALEKATAAQKDVEGMLARREGASENNPGLIPGEELETYRTRSLTAKADTAVASENLKIAQLNLRDSAVRAPLGGVIQTRTVETGQYVQTGYVMATLLKSDPMLLRFQVEPSEAPRIKVGMKARFTLRESRRAFDATISLVSAAADPATHMVGVTGTVDAVDHTYWLRPGSFCDVTIDIGATRESPVIPRTATRATDRGYVVYVADGDVVAERPITMGMNTRDGWVEVRSGLAAGELLVVRGAEALSNGARIRGNRITSMTSTDPAGGDADAGASADPNAGPRTGAGRGDRQRRDAAPPGAGSAAEKRGAEAPGASGATP